MRLLVAKLRHVATATDDCSFHLGHTCLLLLLPACSFRRLPSRCWPTTQPGASPHCQSVRQGGSATAVSHRPRLLCVALQQGRLSSAVALPPQLSAYSDTA